MNNHFSMPIAFRSVERALVQPISAFFGVHLDPRAGCRFHDPASLFLQDPDPAGASFEIGNNAILASQGTDGTLRTLTAYGDTQRTNAGLDRGWRGVWTYKETYSYGPYSFGLHLAGQEYDLARVDWPAHTSLLDNIFPLTERATPEGRLRLKLFTFAPLSADGRERLRAVLYGLLVENVSSNRAAGQIILPRLFAATPPLGPDTVWDRFMPFDFEIGVAGRADCPPCLPFSLAPGETHWTPVVLYMPGDPAFDRINERGVLAWLNDTWTYYRSMLGRLETPGDPYFAAFFERSALQCVQCIGLSGNGHIAGSNWGTRPATRMIWIKDMVHSIQPLALLAPDVVRETIEWLAEFGIRHKGGCVEGGVSHSLGISVSALMMAGLYYQATADSVFFTARPTLRERFALIIRGLLASRRDPRVWLYPSLTLSDGDAAGDYHTGSNVCAWLALRSWARLLREVYKEPDQAADMEQAAERTRADLRRLGVVQGPFGPMFNEGVNADGTLPAILSDGEESDTLLMPVYGFTTEDDPAWLNYINMAISEHNPAWNPRLGGQRWRAELTSYLKKDNGVPVTCTGFMKGLAAVRDAATMNGPNGYFTRLRRLTDADGSLWWWPYGDREEETRINRKQAIGKCGWGAGVFVQYTLRQWLGLDYDAPTRTLRFQPRLPCGDFSWTEARLGAGRFTVRSEHTSAGQRPTVANLNAHEVTIC